MNNAKIYIGAYLCQGMAKQELVEKNNVFTVNPEARQDWETALFFAKLRDNMELQTNIESTLHKYNIPRAIPSPIIRGLVFVAFDE